MQNVKDLVLSREFLDVLERLKVPTEELKKDDGKYLVKGGCVLFTKEQIPDFRGTLDDAVREINSVFKEAKIPYLASIFVNQDGDVRIRVYRVSELFEPDRYTDLSGIDRSRKVLDKIKEKFDSGHKISGKDDFYQDLFLGDGFSEAPMTSDELIYVLSLDTRYIDMVVLEDSARTIKIHMIESEVITPSDMIALMKKFRPEDIDLEQGWIVMWFD